MGITVFWRREIFKQQQRGQYQFVNCQDVFYSEKADKMGLENNNTDHKFSYREYCPWPDDERWELIDGKAYEMSPAPSRRHQEISFELTGILRECLKGKDCKAFAAPFDVMLPGFPIGKEDENDTVVQPVISVICEASRLTDRGCLGAPDLIIEILSPRVCRT